MERRTDLLVRPGYRDIVIHEGLGYVDTVTPDGCTESYWREGIAYGVDLDEIKTIETATRRLFEMFIQAGDHIIANNLFAKLGIPAWAIPAIVELWKDPDDTDNPARPRWYTPMLYGRFDLAPVLDPYDKLVGVKLLEFNADTPTGLVESAVTQWNYALAAGLIGENSGQWNTLFESLVAGWVFEIRKFRNITGRRVDTVHFAYSCKEETGEDALNVGLMMEAARKASERLLHDGEEGFKVASLYMCQIFRAGSANEHDHPVGDQYFSDPDHEPIEVLFKLYPWEWIFQTEFGPSAVENMLMLDGTVWLEPIWKALWSNKGILAVLWDLFKDTDDAGLLLEAYFEGEEPPGFRDNCARKPLHGREGGSLQLIVNGNVIETGPASYDADSGPEGTFVQQALMPLPDFPGETPDETWHPVLGVWMVEDEPVCLALRESAGLITNNQSFFAPHFVTGILDIDKERVS
jgi:glutathionylspermidine synthase